MFFSKFKQVKFYWEAQMTSVKLEISNLKVDKIL